MDVAESIEQARRELAAGHEKQAARLLTDAVYGTHDPELERRIRQLALEGREHAGRFGKRVAGTRSSASPSSARPRARASWRDPARRR